jgi:hypothetical protein
MRFGAGSLRTEPHRHTAVSAGVRHGGMPCTRTTQPHMRRGCPPRDARTGPNHPPNPAEWECDVVECVSARADRAAAPRAALSAVRAACCVIAIGLDAQGQGT